MLKEKAGALAGQIWEALNGTEGLTQKQIKKAAKLKADKDFYLGLGWLLREDKVETSEVEGEVYVKETAQLQPLHPYGVSKVGQDLISFQYFMNDHIRCIRARIFNSTGTRKVNDVTSDFTKRAVEAEKTSNWELKVGNLDTNKDGKLTADDREYCGSSDPKIIYGFNINAGWKGIDLSLMFNGAAGVKRLFDGYEVYGNFSGDAAHPATIWRDAWTPDNHDASMPRIFYDTNSASSSRSVQSDFWLQDTSYLRLKNLQLGYTLPKGWLNSVGVENIRIYYSVENLLTFDKMKINIDPESTSQRLSSYPLLRTHAFGVNVTF